MDARRNLGMMPNRARKIDPHVPLTIRAKSAWLAHGPLTTTTSKPFFVYQLGTSIASALLLASAPALADEPPRPRNVILADLGLHVIGAGYERVLHRFFAVQADLEWYVPWTQGGDRALAVWGVALRTRVFVHLMGNAPNGVWISPVGTFGYGHAEMSDVDRGGPMWSVGASIGYAGTLFRHLHLSIGLGGQYNEGRFGLQSPPSYARFYPTVDGTVGWAF